jgi:hypothetical protein
VSSRRRGSLATEDRMAAGSGSPGVAWPRSFQRRGPTSFLTSAASGPFSSAQSENVSPWLQMLIAQDEADTGENDEPRHQKSGSSEGSES